MHHFLTPVVMLHFICPFHLLRSSLSNRPPVVIPTTFTVLAQTFPQYTVSCHHVLIVPFEMIKFPVITQGSFLRWRFLLDYWATTVNMSNLAGARCVQWRWCQILLVGLKRPWNFCRTSVWFLWKHKINLRKEWFHFHLAFQSDMVCTVVDSIRNVILPAGVQMIILLFGIKIKTIVIKGTRCFGSVELVFEQRL